MSNTRYYPGPAPLSITLRLDIEFSVLSLKLFPSVTNSVVVYIKIIYA